MSPRFTPRCRSSTPISPTNERLAGPNSAGVRSRRESMPRSGFPLLVDRICIGARDLYHDRPGVLSDDQIADALAVAEYASRSVLAWQADAPPGRIAWQLEQAPNDGVEVHQVMGRISVQAGFPVDHALRSPRHVVARPAHR